MSQWSLVFQLFFLDYFLDEIVLQGVLFVVRKKIRKLLVCVGLTLAFELHLAVLRAHFWLYTQNSLLAGSGDAKD